MPTSPLEIAPFKISGTAEDNFHWQLRGNLITEEWLPCQLRPRDFMEGWKLYPGNNLNVSLVGSLCYRGCSKCDIITAIQEILTFFLPLKHFALVLQTLSALFLQVRLFQPWKQYFHARRVQRNGIISLGTLSPRPLQKWAPNSNVP